MDLDLLDCLGRVKLVLCQNFIGLIGLNNIYFFHSYISSIHIHIRLGSENKFRELIKILSIGLIQLFVVILERRKPCLIAE